MNKHSSRDDKYDEDPLLPDSEERKKFESAYNVYLEGQKGLNTMLQEGGGKFKQKGGGIYPFDDTIGDRELASFYDEAMNEGQVKSMYNINIGRFFLNLIGKGVNYRIKTLKILIKFLEDIEELVQYTPNDPYLIDNMWKKGIARIPMVQYLTNQQFQPVMKMMQEYYKDLFYNIQEILLPPPSTEEKKEKKKKKKKKKRYLSWGKSIL